MTSFPRLFEPATVGNMALKNRVISAPHVTRLAAKNGGVTDAMVAYYRGRAQSGVGLVVVEATFLARPYPTRLYGGDDAFIPSLRQLSDAIHGAGAKAAVEIIISRGRSDEFEPVSPSDVPHPETGVIPRPLSLEEIEWLVEANADGTRRARDAGFDAVMVHASHGYLVSEFLSPQTNRRQDRYGGGLENRARFLVELVQRAREKAGADFPVLVRMLGHDRIGYFSFEDAAAVCGMLQEAGAGLIDVTTGVAEAYGWASPPDRIPRASNVDASAVIKRAVTIPVSVTARIDDPYVAERVLEEGKADFVGMARPLLADPDWLQKAAAGRPEEIRRCIACNRCQDFSLENPAPIRCSVNAFGGREAEVQLKPATSPKRVLVVGGGPAGMEAARIAAQRGHRVTLWEKADRLGGQLHLASIPPGKAVLHTLVEYLAGQMDRLGVMVELEKEATPGAVLQLKPDVAIVAAGATPKLLGIPGASSPRVVAAADVLTDKASVGHRVVVLAVDSIGCEVAEFLADRYKDVTVVDPSETVASEMWGYTALMSRSVLVHDLERKMVRILTGARPSAINQEGVIVVDAQGKQQTLPADTVVAAVGFEPRKELFQALEDKLRAYQVGDCAEPRRIMEAIHEAAEVGMSL